MNHHENAKKENGKRGVMWRGEMRYLHSIILGHNKLGVCNFLLRFETQFNRRHLVVAQEKPRTIIFAHSLSLLVQPSSLK